MKVSSRGMRRAGLTIALLLAGIACVALVLARYFYVPPNVIDVDLGGPYRLYAPDYEDQLVILYDRGDGLLVGRIGDVVVDVGWNDAYVVATRRPPDQPGGELSYYYIDIAKETGGGDGGDGTVVGPLTQREFEEAKAALGLPEFTLHYPQLR
jgi:hypothetical protein